MTSARIGYTAKLQQGNGDGPPETFDDIAEVKSISPPGSAMDVHDATHLNSPDGHREFVAGMIDGGEISGVANYLPTDDTQDATTGVYADQLARTARSYKILFPDGSHFVASCFVTLWQPGEINNDGTIDVNFTLKITGKPTFTEAS